MDSIERMGKIMALIEAHPEGICGRALADGCGVPWGTMKQDLKVLVSWIENPIPLYTDHDEGNDECVEDLFLPEVKWFMAAAQKCYTPVHLNVREAVGILATLDFLQEDNALKEGLKQKILSRFDLGEEETYRYIKGELTPLEPIQGKTFPIIENAIRTNRRLTISFNGRKITVDPLGIVYYSRLRYWYLAIRVKVRFLNRAQTLAKVRKDVAHRASELTTLEDGSILFQDSIIGVNEFITWILGFGSAAEILEPMELRSLILKRVRETLKNYKEEVS